MAESTTGQWRSDVSVVIPTHNRRRLLMETVRSVRAQQGVSATIVIVDDGGTDGTAEAISRMSGDICYLRNSISQGVSRARNRGLAAVTTQFVAFLDDDDLYEPTKLRKQLAALDAEPQARWSYSGAVHFDSDVHVISSTMAPENGIEFRAMLDDNLVPGGGSGVVVETALARHLGGFDEKLSILADWDFYIRLSAASASAGVNETLTGYYVHSDSMFHDPSGISRELMRLGEKYPGFDPRSGRWLFRIFRMSLGLGRYRTAGRTAVGLLRRPDQIADFTEDAVAALRRRLRRPAIGPPASTPAWLAAFPRRG